MCEQPLGFATAMLAGSVLPACVVLADKRPACCLPVVQTVHGVHSGLLQPTEGCR